MATSYTDAQILGHFTEGLKKASSAASGMAFNPGLLGATGVMDFLNGLKESSQAAHQMAHARQNPQFFNIRDQLEKMRTMLGKTPINRATWAAVGKMLDLIREGGAALADAKPLPRREVMTMLDRGEKKIAARVEAELARGHTTH